ncbi:MAG: NAD-dependent epimerase/dehydratase family protein [Nitrospina sp.]|jgi:dTDP-glucose 4,6-dehydratase|nr:NAD-dependent epimerase/dehydratase family protein [Nitrospina sp.]MBT5633869.1 NAD-dependent epimerase/dehydratase family protein [Nitrospina sp.]
MSEKYFIIGSNSFSGASFVDFLLKQGHSVMGASRSDELHRAFLPYRWNGKDTGFRFYKYDLNKNLEEIVSLVKNEKPSFVVNFAAQGMVAQSWEYPDHWFMTNVVSTIRLHDRLRHFDFLNKYVHVTTPEVYGSTDGFIKEDIPFNPSTPYAVSRAAADMSLKTFFDAYKFPVVFTRAANVYGPGQQLYRIIPRTILSILTGKKLQLHGGGHSKRSFIHFRDVASATHKIATQGTPGETYHISTNEIVTVRELVEKICLKLDADFDNCVEVVGERLGKDAAYMLDSSKIRQSLGWKDEVSLDEGLEDCIEWVQSNLGDLRDMHWDYVHKP